MKTTKNKSIAAFTLIELMGVIIILAVMARLLLPRPYGIHVSWHSKRCMNNLKQISLGWHLWANDNGGQFPWNVPIQEGGATRNDGSGAFDIVRQFLVASNEIGSPKVIACPIDASKTPVATWEEFRVQPANEHPNISYFYNQDAIMNSPQMILAGDRNLVATKNAPIPQGRMGMASLTLNSNNYNTIDWDQKTLHQGQGIIALADGSVQQANRARVRKQAGIYLDGTTNQMRLNYPGY